MAYIPTEIYILALMDYIGISKSIDKEFFRELFDEEYDTGLRTTPEINQALDRLTQRGTLTKTSQHGGTWTLTSRGRVELLEARKHYPEVFSK